MAITAEDIQGLTRAVEALTAALVANSNTSSPGVVKKRKPGQLPEWLADMFMIATYEDTPASHICDLVVRSREDLGLPPWSRQKISKAVDELGFRRVKVRGIRCFRGLREIPDDD